jgi:hypothetical protein
MQKFYTRCSLIFGMLTFPLFAQIMIESTNALLQGDSLSIQSGKLQVLSSEKNTTIPLDQIIEIDLKRPIRPKQLLEFHFRNTDILYGDFGSDAEGDSFSIESSFLQNKYKTYLTDLESIRFQSPQELPPPEEGLDQLLLKNGDSLKGQIERIQNNGFEFSSKIGRSTLEFADILAVVFSKKTPPQAPSQTLYALVYGIEGSRLQVQIESLQNAILHGKALRFDSPPIQISLEQAAFIRFKQGNFIYLSDLLPIEVLYVPFFEKTLPYQRDLNIYGKPLQIKGRTFTKGLGMFSKTTLIYELESQYRRFKAVIGIDDYVRQSDFP